MPTGGLGGRGQFRSADTGGAGNKTGPSIVNGESREESGGSCKWKETKRPHSHAKKKKPMFSPDKGRNKTPRSTKRNKDQGHVHLKKKIDGPRKRVTDPKQTLDPPRAGKRGWTDFFFAVKLKSQETLSKKTWTGGSWRRGLFLVGTASSEPI